MVAQQQQQTHRPWYEWYRDPANLHLNLNNPREWRLSVLNELDEMPRFDRKIVFVASLGFLIDAYDIFALNFVVPMIVFVYSKEIPQGRIQKAIQVATLVGILLGQVVFGICADIIGRKPTYGLTLWLTILGTISLALTSTGFDHSMSFAGSVIAWRLIMGIGIGADYPLSAAITAEFAPTKFRSRMIATVFFMQPIGQALATVIALICTAAFKSKLECEVSNAAFGLGAVPAALALFFRLTIPESVRYTMDVQRNLARARYDAYWHTQNNAMSASTQLNGHATQPAAPARQISHLEMVQVQHGPMDISFRNPNGSAISSGASVPATAPTADPQPGPPRRATTSSIGSQADSDTDDGASTIDEVVEESGIPSFATFVLGFCSFIFDHGGWRPLIGATMNWLLLDYAFYGIGMSSLNFAAFVWNGGREMVAPIYDTLMQNGRNSIILVSIGASMGGALMIILVSRFQLRTIQLCGFLILAVILILAGAPFEAALEHKAKAWLMLCFIASQIAFNFGPNGTTFILPAEVFPTKYRCTCAGIAAAFGKLGSLLGQLFVTSVDFNGTHVAYGSVRNATSSSDTHVGPFQTNESKATGYTLLTFMPFMILGAVFTYFFTPATQYAGGVAMSLEDLEDKLYGREADWVGKRNLGPAPVQDEDDDI